MYLRSKVFPICAHCKAIRYQQNSHRCKLSKLKPGLLPMDLTFHDFENLKSDPYKKYWKNWKEAVDYREQL